MDRMSQWASVFGLQFLLAVNIEGMNHHWSLWLEKAKTASLAHLDHHGLNLHREPSPQSRRRMLEISRTSLVSYSLWTWLD